MEVKEILKQARFARKMTLKDVAKATGLPVSTIHGWERGAGYPIGRRRDIIAAFYKIPVESLEAAELDPHTDHSVFDISRVQQNIAMTDYQTHAIMLHKKHWAAADEIIKRDGYADYNEMFTDLIKAASRKD